MKAIDSIKSEIYNFQHSLDNKLLQLTHLRNEFVTNKPDIVKDLDEMINEFHETLATIRDVINTEFNNNFFPFIELISDPLEMNPSENGVYKFARGDSPWNFLLKLVGENEEKIKSTIHQEVSTNGLSNCISTPENGTVVLVSDEGNIYRAFILETITKMCCRIMNVDTGEISTVSIDTLNNLPRSLAEFPPQVIYCSLTKDSYYEKYWNDFFSKKFITIMETMQFSIKINEQISVNPPYYEVSLQGSRNGDTIDISDWFFEIFFQNMELYENDFDLFNKYVNDPFDAKNDRVEQSIDSQRICYIQEKSGNNDDIALLEGNDLTSHVDDILFIQAAFENFSKNIQNKESNGATQNDESSIHLPPKQELDGDNKPHDYEKHVKFVKVGFNETCNDLMETFKFQKSSSDEEDIQDLGDQHKSNSKDKVSICRKETLAPSPLNKEQDENVRDSDELCRIDVTLLEPSIGKERKEQEEVCRLASSPDRGPLVEEKICRAHIKVPIMQQTGAEVEVEEDMGDLVGEYESDITFVDADIGEECKDEVKTCKFQLQKGHCWKEYCPREHIDAGPGYIGSVYTYAYFDVEYPLPEQNETIYVNPKMIVSGHKFYGHLIDYIQWNQPDLKLLEMRMNSNEEVIRFEHFDLLPTFGELCLAYGESRRWYRARIIEVNELQVQVTSVDYGHSEKVSLHDIRRIKYEYLFLPPQAIRFQLGGIEPVERRQDEAMKYMRDVALNQIFKAIVKESNQQESSIEISFICQTGRKIEASLIAKGYYRTIKPS